MPETSPYFYGYQHMREFKKKEKVNRRKTRGNGRELTSNAVQEKERVGMKRKRKNKCWT